MFKIEMVTISAKRSINIDLEMNIDGSVAFEDDVNDALEKIEKNHGRIVGIDYKFAVEKKYYIYTAMIVYEENEAVEKLEIVENYSPLELKTIIALLEDEMLCDETGHPYTRGYFKRFVRRINEKDS